MAANEVVIVVKARDDASRVIDKIGKNLGSFLKRGAIAGGVALIGMGVAASKMAIDFESAFADVRKTVSATEPVLEELRQGIRRMSQEVPLSASAIAGVSAAAGQLGIAVPNILAFTRVMVDLGVTTNLSSTEAATSLARLANITGLSQGDFDRLGSTIVALGNNLATTEREIVDMALRLAAAGTQAGISEAQILSIAGAMSSMGLSSEAGGTAMSRVILEMNKAVATGSEELATFAAVAGQSVADFARSFKQDATGAVLEFFEGLGGLSDSQLFAVLEKLGFENVRVRDTILRTSGAVNVLTDALDIGTKGWSDNNDLTEEAAQRYATTASKLKIAWNQVVNLGISLGGTLLPALGKLLDFTGKVIAGLQAMTGDFAAIGDAQLEAARKTLVFTRELAELIRLAAGAGALLAALFGRPFIAVGLTAAAIAANRAIGPLNERLEQLDNFSLNLARSTSAAGSSVRSMLDAVLPTTSAVSDLSVELDGLGGGLSSAGSSIESEFNDPIREARILVDSLRQELFRLLSMPTTESAREDLKLTQLRLDLLNREVAIERAREQRKSRVGGLKEELELLRERLREARNNDRFTALGIRLLEERIDAKEDEITAVEDARSAVEREAAAIEDEIAVLERLNSVRTLEQGLLAARLDIADQTLLSDQELAGALERLITRTGELTGEINTQVGDIRSQWIPALGDAAVAVGGIGTAMGDLIGTTFEDFAEAGSFAGTAFADAVEQEILKGFVDLVEGLADQGIFINPQGVKLGPLTLPPPPPLAPPNVLPPTTPPAPNQHPPVPDVIRPEDIAQFVHGGSVPGPLGQAQLAVVHGGEQVLTAAQQRQGSSQPSVVNVFIENFIAQNTVGEEMASIGLSV